MTISNNGCGRIALEGISNTGCHFWSFRNAQSKNMNTEKNEVTLSDCKAWTLDSICSDNISPESILGLSCKFREGINITFLYTHSLFFTGCFEKTKGTHWQIQVSEAKWHLWVGCFSTRFYKGNGDIVSIVRSPEQGSGCGGCLFITPFYTFLLVELLSMCLQLTASTHPHVPTPPHIQACICKVN